MVEQSLNSLLFYFFSAEFRCREKVRNPPNYPRFVFLLGSFSIFLGGTLVLQIGDTVGPRNTAAKISAISYYPLAQQSCGGDIGSVPYVCM